MLLDAIPIDQMLLIKRKIAAAVHGAVCLMRSLMPAAVVASKAVGFQLSVLLCVCVSLTFCVLLQNSAS